MQSDAGFYINARLPDNEAHVPGVKRSHSKRWKGTWNMVVISEDLAKINSILQKVSSEIQSANSAFLENWKAFNTLGEVSTLCKKRAKCSRCSRLFCPSLHPTKSLETIHLVWLLNQILTHNGLFLGSHPTIHPKVSGLKVAAEWPPFVEGSGHHPPLRWFLRALLARCSCTTHLDVQTRAWNLEVTDTRFKFWELLRCTIQFHQDMDVSENSGNPKSSILIGISIINHPFWGIPIFGNTHIWSWRSNANVKRCCAKYIEMDSFGDSPSLLKLVGSGTGPCPFYWPDLWKMPSKICMWAVSKFKEHHAEPNAL